MYRALVDIIAAYYWHEILVAHHIAIQLLCVVTYANVWCCFHLIMTESLIINGKEFQYDGALFVVG